MRTDVKIGIAVGAIIVVIAVVFFLSNNKHGQVPDQPRAQAPAPKNVVDPLPHLAPARPSSAPAIDDRPLSEVLRSPEPASRPAGEAFGRLSAPPPTGSADASLHAPPAGAAAISGTHTVAAGEYVVKPGDNFWVIAERIYGNGKYHTLIEQANPGVSPTALKVGQKLKYPAMSVASSAAPTSAPAGHTAAAGAGSTPARTASAAPARPTVAAASPASDGRPRFRDRSPGN